MKCLTESIEQGILRQEWELIPESEEELKALICDFLVKERLSVKDGSKIVLEARNAFTDGVKPHIILTTDDAKVTGYRIRIFNLN